MEVSLALGRKAIAAAAVMVVLIVVLLGWVAGEAHYRNCLTAADLRHPATSQPLVEAGGKFNEFNKAGRGHFVLNPEDGARNEAIDGCSRLPW